MGLRDDAAWIVDRLVGALPDAFEEPGAWRARNERLNLTYEYDADEGWVVTIFRVSPVQLRIRRGPFQLYCRVADGHWMTQVLHTWTDSGDLGKLSRDQLYTKLLALVTSQYSRHIIDGLEPLIEAEAAWYEETAQRLHGWEIDTHGDGSVRHINGRTLSLSRQADNPGVATTIWLIPKDYTSLDVLKDALEMARAVQPDDQRVAVLHDYALELGLIGPDDWRTRDDGY